jgi:Pumilio-family RNA binding repeat
MSLESSAAGATPAPGLCDDSASQQEGVIGALGHVLEGVSLGPNQHQGSGAAFGSFHDERRDATSGNPFNVASGHRPPQGNTAAWGGFSNPESSRNSFARPNTSSPSSGRAEVPRTRSHSPELPIPDRLERKQSIDLFLSRSPSQMLGNDVFKLSAGNLPVLPIREDGERPSGDGTPSSGSFGNFRSAGGAGVQALQEQRRESPVSNMTGTTTSTGSRSNSPYEGGSGVRTIQPYHRYDTNDPSPMASNGAVGAASAYSQMNNHGGTSFSMYQEYGSNIQYVETTSSPRIHSPYTNTGSVISNNAANTNIAFNQFDPGDLPAPISQHPQVQIPPPSGAASQQPQHQVLYMAVSTPDGRGQVLQPVQMVQLQGKPFAYVLPGADGGMAARQMPSMQGGQPVMVLPNLVSQQSQLGPPVHPPPQQVFQGQSVDSTNGMIGLTAGGGRNPVNLNKNPMAGYPGPPDPAHTGGPYSGSVGGLVSDDYGPLQVQAGIGGDVNQYLNQISDSTIASLYSTPQRPPLDALLGQVRRLSRDQVGCRLVQQALDEEGAMAATLILNEGLPFWGEAMVDPFGNYLFQKILERITAEERILLVKSVSARLVNASLNLHGTRSVQKIVELCAVDDENGDASKDINNEGAKEESASDVLARALAPAAARLCIDSHGNHVIQRILLKLGHKHSKFVFDAVAESVGDVARHRHGCCVIQRCLDSPPGPARSHLVLRIVDKSLELMQDAYGNYVVQYVLDVCSDEDVHAVCESVVGKVTLLAIQKFSSNVMEKCLERCTDHVKEQYMQELSDTERIRELMMDPFGNYVVQRALSVATHAQAVRLVEAMRPHLLSATPGTPNGQRNGGVRNTAGGRRIMAKICRRFPNFNINAAGTQEELYSQNRGRHTFNHHNPAGTLAPMYGMSQLTATAPPVPFLQQQAPQQQQLLYNTNPNPLEYQLNMSGIQPYVLGDAAYFQQHPPQMGQGPYPNM